MGSAPCLELDLENITLDIGYLQQLEWIFDYMAIGLDCADRYLGRIKHCATYHPSDLAAFRERREKAGGNLDYTIHSHVDRLTDAENINKINVYSVDRIWPMWTPSGGSSLLGVQVGIGLGYEKIIVAGSPLLDDKYVVESDFRKGWIRHLDEIKDNARSMSGWTRELLGGPTEEWLND